MDSELAVPIYRGRESLCFARDDTGVTIELSDGAWLRASYLVGCDGGRSLVRKAAGMEFRGWDATTSNNYLLDFHLVTTNSYNQLVQSQLCW